MIWPKISDLSPFAVHAGTAKGDKSVEKLKASTCFNRQRSTLFPRKNPNRTKSQTGFSNFIGQPPQLHDTNHKLGGPPPYFGAIRLVASSFLFARNDGFCAGSRPVFRRDSTDRTLDLEHGWSDLFGDRPVPGQTKEDSFSRLLANQRAGVGCVHGRFWVVSVHRQPDGHSV